MTRILIADDHRLTVDGTVKLLWEEWSDLLTAFTVPDAIQQVDLHKPDLILLDLWFPGCGSSGFFVLEHCQRKQLSTRILITSAFDDRETVGWARNQKAQGFIGKHRSGAELIAAIHLILAGGESWPPPPPPAEELPPLLLYGHRRVLRCVRSGMTYAETATALALAEATVEKYLGEARRRLGARNTPHAVAIAERRGLFLLHPLPDEITPTPNGGDELDLRDCCHQASRPLAESEAVVRSAGLTVVERVPMFVIMNYPTDTRGRRPKWLWTAMVSPAMVAEPLGWLLGAALYPVEHLLNRVVKESPSVELMVCRRG